MKTGLSIKLLNAFLPVAFLLLATASFAQLQFIENKGQWDKQVDYKSGISNGAFFLQQQGFTVVQQNEKDLLSLSEMMHGHDDGGKKAEQKYTPQSASSIITLRQHAYRVRFSGASSSVKTIPDKALPTYNNYFYGSDPSKWQGGCKLYQAVTYKDMYPNIDVRYYTDQGTLKYDLIVHPGGNIDNIVLKYEGIDRLSVKNKELIIGTSVGDVKELYPYTYQFGKEGRQTLDCKYVVDEKTKAVRFKVKDYDPGATIVIDPTLIFCSFSGSSADNWGYTATPGPDGSMFGGGIAFDTGFPVTVGAFQTRYNGGRDDDNSGPYDVAIIKLSPNGSTRLYATYLGGSGNEQPHSMMSDEQGNLVVAGRTNSPLPREDGIPFPLSAPTQGPCGNYDIFIVKFNAAGTGIIGSIRIGGTSDDGVNIKSKYAALNLPGQADGAYDTRRNYGDDARSEVIIDDNNNIYLAGCTQSIDFPVNNSGIQRSFAGGGANFKQDGVIAKFPPNLSAVTFSTFFGGNGNDACFVLAISPVSGNLYVAGGTTSTNLPGSTTGTVNPTYQGGGTDGFVTQVTPDGAAIIKTTYIGTNDGNPGNDGFDIVYGIQFDKFGFPYIMGTTTGNWQAKNATFSNVGGKQFIAKLQPDLSDYVYTTMFGTNTPAPNISPIAFLVDRCQNVYVSGWGGSLQTTKEYPNAGTGGLNFLITPDAVQSRTDGSDFFFFVLEKDAQSQLFGSYFGQVGGFTDHVDGGTSRFDANGVIYQGICANCKIGTNNVFFPTTPGVYGPRNNSPSCNEAMVKIEMNFGGVGANIRTVINNIPNAIYGCNPLTLTAFDSLSKAQRFFWNWGDGSKVDTLYSRSDTTHLYTLPPNKDSMYYTIMLVAEDSGTCNIRDTAYKTIKVSTNFATLGFRFEKLQPCTNLSFQFTNESVAFLGSFDNKGFTWDFGDGAVDTGNIRYSPVHRYASPGDYIVRLCVRDSFVCNSPDCYVDTVRVATLTRAIFTTPSSGCVPYLPVFKNTSLGGEGYIWDFGDGTFSNEYEPANKIYNRVGTYNVKLTVIDSSTCNIIDDTTVTITVYPIPVASGFANPTVGEANKPINFFNNSTGATRYLWEFGDSETSTDAQPSHTFNESNNFIVKLIAFNAAGCSDTAFIPITAKVIPLLDVPNAFTPGKFGINGSISVAGFGIGKMDWRIYNRWGQLVFQTSNRKDSWNGTFKGAVQPMDVYTYTLDVVFTDGKKLRKTGDITLLR